MIQPSTQSGTKLREAESLSIYVCDDEHVHISMGDHKFNPLIEMCVSPEEALSIAKRIEQAADAALGIS